MRRFYLSDEDIHGVSRESTLVGYDGYLRGILVIVFRDLLDRLLHKFLI